MIPSDLVIDDNVLTDSQRRAIDAEGLVILPPNPALARRLEDARHTVDELLAAEGSRAGWEGKEQYFAPGKPFEPGANRLGNLVDKMTLAADLIVLPELLAVAGRVLGDAFKVGSVLMREPLKDHGHQALHIDWLPRETATDPFGGIVAQFVLDDVQTANGAMRYVPGSHRHLGWPDDHIDIHAPHPGERRAEAPAGSLIVMNLNLWHAGAMNATGERRRSVFVNIRRRDLPQLLNQKMYLSPATIERLTPVQRYLLAVRPEDATQVEKSVGPNDRYRERFGSGQASAPATRPS